MKTRELRHALVSSIRVCQHALEWAELFLSRMEADESRYCHSLRADLRDMRREHSRNVAVLCFYNGRSPDDYLGRPVDLKEKS